MIEKWIKKRHLLISLLLLTAVTIKSQTQVRGVVSDQQGLEVIGATVIVKGKPAAGTVTDLNGKYVINVDDITKDILVISYLGMNEVEMKVNGKTTIDVKMQENSILLDEIVAVGYGTMRRSDISGSVSSLKGKEVAKIPVTNVAQALAGKIAGVQVTQSQGSPDASIDIRVRGGMSITQSNDPLYIIDGFVSESGLKGIDPSDIESIDVLKDASATAIYGSAGANGVILIATKKAKEGKASITYDMYIGFKKLTKRLDLLNSEEYIRLEYERAMIGGDTEKQNFVNRYGDKMSSSMSLLDNMYLANSQIHDVYGNRPGINWQDEVFKGNSPMSVNHKVGISGGTKELSYNVSYSYSNDDGIMKNSGLTRNNVRGRFAFQVNPKIKITTNVNYTDETTTGLGSLNEAGQFSRMQHIIQYRPIYEKYLADELLLNLQKDPVMEDDNGNQMQNPLISIEAEDRTNKNKILALSGDLNYSILKNLSYRASISYRIRTADNELFYKRASRQAMNSGNPFGKRDEAEYNTVQFTQTVKWDKKFNKLNRMDIMVGQEYLDRNDTYRTHIYTGFQIDDLGLNNLGLANQMDIPSSSTPAQRTFSLFSRVNYNHADKYLATATLRADESTLFESKNRWGYFPALSFAWRAVEEDFIKNLNVFSDLKARLSYGTSGNNKISPNLIHSIMGSINQPFNNANTTGFARPRLANPNLKWETNKTANIGLDLGFFDQKIQANVDVYKNVATDLLLQVDIPKYIEKSGKVMKNMGETENTGIEFSITSVNVNSNDFNWTTSLNLSHNKNKVKKLTDVDNILTRSGWAASSEFNAADYITQVGRSVGLMYGYKTQGLYTVGEKGKADFYYDEIDKKTYVLNPGIPYDPTLYDPNNPAKSALKPGYWKYEDTDQSEGQAGIINENDKQVIGDATPDLYGGIVNSFTYKGFDLSLGITFKLGGDVYNANKMYFTKMNNKNRNSLKQSADRFTYIDETGKNVYTNPDALAAINKNAKTASIDGSSNMVFHSEYVEDGSFLRFDNLTFGYTLPKKLINKAFLSNLRVYVSTYNLFTISGYDGFDPEVNVKPNGGLSPSVDWGAYPRSFSFVFGLNMTL